MWLELQTGIGVPLSRQVYEQIKALILRGDLKAEEKLPSSRTLGKDLGIARHTVLDAYEQLLAEGYLEDCTGAFVRVCPAAPFATAVPAAYGSCVNPLRPIFSGCAASACRRNG